jgi:tetraacyldisaccharide-1-P 4'-kinase
VKASVLIGKLNLSRGGSEKDVGDEIVLMAEEAAPVRHCIYTTRSETVNTLVEQNN